MCIVTSINGVCDRLVCCYDILIDVCVMIVMAVCETGRGVW